MKLYLTNWGFEHKAQFRWDESKLTACPVCPYSLMCLRGGFDALLCAKCGSLQPYAYFSTPLSNGLRTGYTADPLVFCSVMHKQNSDDYDAPRVVGYAIEGCPLCYKVLRSLRSELVHSPIS